MITTFSGWFDCGLDCDWGVARTATPHCRRPARRPLWLLFVVADARACVFWGDDGRTDLCVRRSQSP